MKPRRLMPRNVTLAAALAVFFAFVTAAARAGAATYEVGPTSPYQSIGAVPWESLQAGDTVLIHWRSEPYREKWVIGRQGTANAPITVRGVAGPAGQLPVIDGSGATTRQQLDYWGEPRGVIKIGGSNVPPDTTPRHIVIEGLEIRNARPPHTFRDDGGTTQSYTANASTIYIEKGENITIRNCALHDAGNGLFVASSNTLASREILIEGNHIYDNGNPGSITEHNVYTAAIGIVFEYNWLGPLLAGASGNNLKDRSAGLVVRYNWIEGGNRQLDLVDGSDSSLIRGHSAYRQSFVYGNVLIEPPNAGNRQVVHYGGDSGKTNNYRKGTLFFYQNTVLSKRTDRTTLFRLSTNSERADTRNSIVYLAAAGDTLALLDASGVLDLTHNWFKPGYVKSFSSGGTLNDDGTSILGTDPRFVDEPGADYHLAADSQCINAGTDLNASVLPTHDVLRQYTEHQAGQDRHSDGSLDLGAFELASGPPADLEITTAPVLPSATVGLSYALTLAAKGGLRPYSWAVDTLPQGLAHNEQTGAITGTPTTAGSYSVEATVTDAQEPADEASKSLLLTVEPAPPLVITTSSLAAAKRNKNYSQTLAATGGVRPYTWAIESGALPPGLSLGAATGVISGRPTTRGTFGFVVRVTDGQAVAYVASRGFSIVVR